jgi:hypothetical protein
MNWLVGLVSVLGKVVVQWMKEGHVYQECGIKVNKWKICDWTCVIGGYGFKG